uniref:Phosphatidate cytidylyltransferase n=1 Tax=Candidatus Kentrum sp. FW TaxID=2126338 RepID=A0A450TPX9_9GAMM|nr:MAG: phosphatidate cytidylyltransferase [Candidatus Kentron sp. FW]
MTGLDEFVMDTVFLSESEIAIRVAQIILGTFVVLAVTISLIHRFRDVEHTYPKKDEGNKTTWKPLWVRLATLMVLTLLVFVSAWWSAISFSIVISIILILCLAEYHRFTERSGTSPLRFYSYPGILFLIAGTISMGSQGMLIGLTAAILIFLLSLLTGYRNPDRIHQVGIGLFGVLYIGMLGAYMILIRHLPQGFGWVAFLLFVVQMADGLALLGGLAFGRHKLAPLLSPGKTWEGTVVGMLGAVLGGWLLSFAVPGVHTGLLLLMAALLGIAAFIGDLVASAMKRIAGIKDFGTLLPGHGGILDRLDSYLVAAPTAWLLIRFWSP